MALPATKRKQYGFRSFTLYVTGLTFVLQSESGRRHADVWEEVQVELVGGAVEEGRDRGAFREEEEEEMKRSG